MVMHGYVGWCSGIDGFLITLISGSLQKGSEPFLYLTLCQLIIAAMFKCLYPELSRVDSDVSPCDEIINNFVFPESEWAEWAIGS